MSGLAPEWAIAAVGTWPVVLVLSAAAAWALHVRRLRARERELLAVVEEHNRQWQRSGEARARCARVLMVTPLERRDGTVLQLAGLDLDVGRADSTWSAGIACREAFEDGRPYNLVLLDAALSVLEEPSLPERLQADLVRWGARVGVMRVGVPGAGRHPRAVGAGPTCFVDHVVDGGPPRNGTREEGTGLHENPDRRGRSGFPPAPAADAAAVGVRSRRGE